MTKSVTKDIVKNSSHLNNIKTRLTKLNEKFNSSSQSAKRKLNVFTSLAAAAKKKKSSKRRSGGEAEVEDEDEV